ncbi:hypothetical protein [Bacillus sp. 71mf]|uniref:hypothetical protein n=1 Tax=Bacillus sp. 71mf TaxID=1761757 RepID=UPI001587B72A|nr:hypothetical protein [Bacillus sp. 71mf]
MKIADILQRMVDILIQLLALYWHKWKNVFGMKQIRDTETTSTILCEKELINEA